MAVLIGQQFDTAATHLYGSDLTPITYKWISVLTDTLDMTDSVPIDAESTTRYGYRDDDGCTRDVCMSRQSPEDDCSVDIFSIASWSNEPLTHAYISPTHKID